MLSARSQVEITVDRRGAGLSVIFDSKRDFANDLGKQKVNIFNSFQ